MRIEPPDLSGFLRDLSERIAQLTDLVAESQRESFAGTRQLTRAMAEARGILEGMVDLQRTQLEALRTLPVADERQARQFEDLVAQLDLLNARLVPLTTVDFGTSATTAVVFREPEAKPGSRAMPSARLPTPQEVLEQRIELEALRVRYGEDLLARALGKVTDAGHDALGVVEAAQGES
ncbi:hypothetical protein [Acrocarpospora sp. B8E8]|uniref:hypothetical protein n=1 Tax=Acrocarpospora sp. B8E8 TaxID=3153572 RepID=UPI00325CF96A